MTTLRALVTSGPTIERLDPVRYLSNFSSGKQGHAIAAELVEQGIETTLISGPVHIEPPQGATLVQTESAADMLAACEQALPVDIAICAAAVCDWSLEPSKHKRKKQAEQEQLTLTLGKTPDILYTLSTHKQRPQLVVGFAAETENVAHNATQKRKDKHCDWILANHVGTSNSVFGADHNTVRLITSTESQAWPKMTKRQIAHNLVTQIIQHLNERKSA